MKDIRQIYSDIYDAFVDKIYRFVFLKVNSQEVAEDITSETFARCWDKYKNEHTKIENPQAFLYQIARNLIIDHYREKGRTQFVSIESLPILDPRSTLEEEAAKTSDIDNIKTVLANLKDDYREVIILHYIEDIPVPEIAKITGKSEGAVRVTLHRALELLRNQIKQA